MSTSFEHSKDSRDHDLKVRKDGWQRIALIVSYPILASIALPLAACILLDWPVSSTEASAALSPPAKPDRSVIVWGAACDQAGCTPAALLFGRIPDNSEVVTAKLQTRPDIKTLCLRSPGGSGKGGVALASWLSENGYDTCIPSVDTDQAVCASACTYVFAAGKQRNADRQAAVGIHGSAHPALIQYPADTITGKSGSPRGQCAFCKGLSFTLNTGVSVISHAWTWAWAPGSELMTKLLLESVFIPAHTIRLLSSAEMVNWSITTRPADGVLAWQPRPR